MGIFAACRSLREPQVVLADGAMMPPLSWPASRDGDAAYVTERLHCYEVLRLKAAAVMHTLSSKCGADAFLSILRGLIQTAVVARRAEAEGEGAVRGDAVAQPWVLSTTALLKQVAQVRHSRHVAVL